MIFTKFVRSTARYPGPFARWKNEDDTCTLATGGSGVDRFPKERKYIVILIEARDRQYRIEVDPSEAEEFARAILGLVEGVKRYDSKG